MTTKLRITNYWQLTTGNWRLNTSPERAQKELIMQNKANFPNAQMNVSYVSTMDYVNIRLRSRRQNKAKQSQFKANQTQFQPKYAENKANSNPIQTQFFSLFILPMLPIHPNQTQPVVSMPALSKVEVSNLFQPPAYLFFINGPAANYRLNDCNISDFDGLNRKRIFS